MQGGIPSKFTAAVLMPTAKSGASSSKSAAAAEQQPMEPTFLQILEDLNALDGIDATPDLTALKEWPEWTTNVTVSIDGHAMTEFLHNSDRKIIEPQNVIKIASLIAGRYHCIGANHVNCSPAFKRVPTDGPEMDVTLVCVDGQDLGVSKRQQQSHRKP